MGVEELKARLARPRPQRELAVLEQKLSGPRRACVRRASPLLETPRRPAGRRRGARRGQGRRRGRARPALAEIERLRGGLELLTGADRRAEEGARP